MPNNWFQFKQFTIWQNDTAMKVTTDSCIFGAWCAQQISAYNNLNTGHLLDIGTGTGLLSLMIAQKNHLVIDAVEIDENACQQAVENIKQSSYSNINIIHSDVEHLPAKKYDFIISNPPFYESELVSPHLNKNIAHHGEGLKWISLFRIIRERLNTGGKFYLLLPAKREMEIRDLLDKNDLAVNKYLKLKQTPQHLPFRIIIEGSYKSTEIITEELVIKDEKGSYTPSFVQLLKDYYLYL